MRLLIHAGLVCASGLALAGAQPALDEIAAAGRQANQAMAFYHQGRYTEAEPLLVQALAVYEKARPSGRARGPTAAERVGVRLVAAI